MSSVPRRVVRAALRLTTAAGFTATAAGAAAQATPPRPSGSSATDCPVVGGIRASVTVRDSGRAVPRELVRIDRQAAVDTTFTFDVAERRWNLAELAASLAAGLADTSRGRWYLCAGAAVGLYRPVLVIRGARGRVRLRASLGELSRALGRAQPDPAPARTPPRRS